MNREKLRYLVVVALCGVVLVVVYFCLKRYALAGLTTELLSGDGSASMRVLPYENPPPMREPRDWRVCLLSDRELARVYLDAFYGAPGSKRARACYWKLYRLFRRRHKVTYHHPIVWVEDGRGGHTWGGKYDRRCVKYAQWGLSCPSKYKAAELAIPDFETRVYR